MWECLERVAAIAGGCVVAATGLQDPGSMVGAVVGAAGVMGYFGDKFSTHGLENSSNLAKIQRAVIAELGDPPKWPGVDPEIVEGWDWSLAQTLPQCMLNRAALSDAIFDKNGFPTAATAVVHAELARIDPQFSKGPGKKFAEHLISTALSAAFEERTYFESLAPYLWASLGRRVDAIEKTGKETLAVAQQGLAASEQIGADVKRMLELLESRGLGDKAEQQGVPRPAVRQIIQRLADLVDGPQTEDDFLTWLEGWIDAAAAQLQRGSNDGAAFEVARMEADELFRIGQTEKASEPLMTLLKQEQEKANDRQRTILERAIDMDLLALQPDNAFEKLVMLATLKSEQGRAKEIVRAMHFVSSREDNSNLRGDAAGLRFAIQAYRWATRQFSAKRFPLEKCAALADLGVTQFHLAQLTGSSILFQDAFASLRAAEIFSDRERYPFLWSVIKLQTLNVKVEMAKRDRNFSDVLESMKYYEEAFSIIKENGDESILKQMATIISSANMVIAELLGNTDIIEKTISILQDCGMRESSQFAYALFIIGKEKSDIYKIAEAIKIQRNYYHECISSGHSGLIAPIMQQLLLMLIDYEAMKPDIEPLEDFHGIESDISTISNEFLELSRNSPNPDNRLFAESFENKLSSIHSISEGDLASIEKIIFKWNSIIELANPSVSYSVRLYAETERAGLLGTLAVLRGDISGVDNAIGLHRDILDVHDAFLGRLEVGMIKEKIAGLLRLRDALSGDVAAPSN